MTQNDAQIRRPERPHIQTHLSGSYGQSSYTNDFHDDDLSQESLRVGKLLRLADVLTQMIRLSI